LSATVAEAVSAIAAEVVRAAPRHDDAKRGQLAIAAEVVRASPRHDDAKRGQVAEGELNT
jgi:hypothetical protein